MRPRNRRSLCSTHLHDVLAVRRFAAQVRTRARCAVTISPSSERCRMTLLNHQVAHHGGRTTRASVTPGSLQTSPLVEAWTRNV